MMHGTVWMNLKSILLNQRSWIQKFTYFIIPFTSMKRLGKSIETASRLAVARALGVSDGRRRMRRDS